MVLMFVFSTSGAILLRVVYGYTEDKVQARYVQTADQAVNDLYIAVSGKFLVDIFPFCKPDDVSCP
jgi:hypothetical protein